MVESDQLVPFVVRWDLVAPPKFQLLNHVAVSSLPASDFTLTSLLERIQIDDMATYVRQPNDEHIQSVLDALNQLFACEPCQVIEAFAEYISPSERYVDGPWNGQRQEVVSSGAVSSVPRDRQVCIETAAKDHVVHLETITLAEEQEAPTAAAVGQMLISGRELWMRWKRKLLHLLSRYSRNCSTVGFQIAFANAVQASSY